MLLFYVVSILLLFYVISIKLFFLHVVLPHCCCFRLFYDVVVSRFVFYHVVISRCYIFPSIQHPDCVLLYLPGHVTGPRPIFTSRDTAIK